MLIRSKWPHPYLLLGKLILGLEQRLKLLKVNFRSGQDASIPSLSLMGLWPYLPLTCHLVCQKVMRLSLPQELSSPLLRVLSCLVLSLSLPMSTLSLGQLQRLPLLP